MARRKGQGRGRLSSIDLLPDEATSHVQWAVDELLANERPQNDILDEFNERLAAVGCKPVSASAFNRHSMRLAATTRRMKETQEITRAITERLGPNAGDQMTIGLATLLKQAAWDLAERGELDPENVMFLSRSLQSVASAQKTSADLRRATQAEVDAKLKKAAEAVQAVAKERGLTQDTIDIISQGIMGVAK